MVSDLVELARSGHTGRDLVARVPARFRPETRRAPVVVWNLCRHCNQSCPHCYASAGPKRSSADLSTEEARRLVDDLARYGVRVLIFSGGEPLLREDLLELVEHASERGIGPYLSTNGTLLDAGRARELAAAGLRYVGVSLDGPPSMNDAYRGMPGGFARAAAGLCHAREAGMRTGIRMTLTRRNAGELEAMLCHARDLGVHRFYVSHLVYAGRAKRIMGDDLTPPACRALLLRLFRYAEGMLSLEDAPRIVTGGNDSDGALLLRWIEQRHGPRAASRVADVLRRRGGNSAGEGIVDIDHRGRVHPDQFWHGVTFGDVRIQSFAEIMDHPMRHQLASRIGRLEGRCGRCAFVDVCRGSHRERAVARHGDPWAPDPACVLTDAEVGAMRPVFGGAA